MVLNILFLINVCIPRLFTCNYLPSSVSGQEDVAVEMLNTMGLTGSGIGRHFFWRRAAWSR